LRDNGILQRLLETQWSVQLSGGSVRILPYITDSKILQQHATCCSNVAANFCAVRAVNFADLSSDRLIYLSLIAGKIIMEIGRDRRYCAAATFYNRRGVHQLSHLCYGTRYFHELFQSKKKK